MCNRTPFLTQCKESNFDSCPCRLASVSCQILEQTKSAPSTVTVLNFTLVLNTLMLVCRSFLFLAVDISFPNGDNCPLSKDLFCHLLRGKEKKNYGCMILFRLKSHQPDNGK